MNATLAGLAATPQPLDALLKSLRPRLHRYCARMTGSAVDGEDVLQDALLKAVSAFPDAGPVANVEAWLFRIAHNAALDFLRRRARQENNRSDEDMGLIADASASADSRHVAAASLRTFMRLPVTQRSCVILMDVLGHSLEEVVAVTGMTLPAVKAALHRGRARLREIADEPDDRPLPVLAEPERSLLAAYIDRFNARDFDALRNMLGENVRLELVSHLRLNGRKEVSSYFGNYASISDWRLVAGLADGRPAILVCDPGNLSAPPAYFILLRWADGTVTGIRDFRYARYIIESADIVVDHDTA
ncbi:RNA polymerase sigma-70 factor, ECF subfamily [Mesorhizobium albiziae]|uniref:RNA polymerase sigma-70 factor, ECF subfamily n=1 Tax=Neomesorhizobium albiziae TaxID=335020 RepID=A0A1I4AZE3_9HYPH|nr:sigma-70 family RNA polymerase sigma factor [Mesorhizobium albiziae]GLS34197.1 DNA-directed RNA polymerase sigma-70 factor [Mesorhizobium albiziae]SFK61814.1 RNA polymerase sigma-70 factor, ECF subfamily [Mesorhizobium albiziae]